MMSLLDLYLNRQPQGGLLSGGYAPSNELIDRMTFLPIGQYEDGSLTLAWPGFLKDAYEGAVRSYEQGRQLPKADESGFYAGTPRAEPLDAFNAASLAPMASIGMRAAGMTTGPTRDAFMAENLMRKFPEEKVISGGAPGHRNDWFPGDRYGDAYWDSSRGLARENEIPRASRMNGMSWDPSTPPMNDLAGGPMTDYDLGALNQAWRNKVVRTGELFANPTESSLPYLMTNGMEGEEGQATTHPFVPPKLGFWPPDPQDNEMRREMRREGLIPEPEKNYRMFRMRPPAPFDMNPWNRLLEQEYDRMFKDVPREDIPKDMRRPLEIFDWPDDGMPITSR